jgi:hypothetical protein
MLTILFCLEYNKYVQAAIELPIDIDNRNIVIGSMSYG